MKIVYGFKDIIRLIRAECEEKGAILASASDASTSREAAVAFEMEWATNTPRQLPAPAIVEETAPPPVPAEVTPARKDEPQQTQQEKNREYGRTWYAKNKAAKEKLEAGQAHAREVIVQATGQPPYHANTETQAERQARRDAAVAQRVEQEVVAPSVAPFRTPFPKAEVRFYPGSR